MSFDHSHYVANVRWKAAEREALQWLENQEKSRLTPLIELIPRNFQTKDGEALPFREALHNVAVEIDSSWGSSPAFVDLEHLLNAGICGNDGDPHILEILSEKIRSVFPLFSGKSTLVPVTNLARADEFQRAVASIVEEDKTGACLRVMLAEVTNEGFSTKLERLLSQLRLEVVDTDLIVDLQSSNGSTPNLQSICMAL